ncbi:hypothetical protein MNV49_007361 [Pseudohyphozyma bogoriensis]|nr:hypothetical protein MNV49_007361 [Pseudohyphozyma bogoriensis]
MPKRSPIQTQEKTPKHQFRKRDSKLTLFASPASMSSLVLSALSSKTSSRNGGVPYCVNWFNVTGRVGSWA